MRQKLKLKQKLKRTDLSTTSFLPIRAATWGSPINQEIIKKEIIMKKITALLCTAILALGLTACGSKEKEVTVDTAKLASELQETITSDTLSETASDMLPSIYFFEADDVAESVAYASSGATACEIAVVKNTDSKNTENMEKLFQTRVDNQSALYASYNQGEVDKLDKAIIKSVGAYTVLCVCDDVDAANKILSNYGF